MYYRKLFLKLNILLILLLVGSLFYRAFVSNSIVTAGNELSKMEQEIAKQKNVNRILTGKYLEFTSFNHIYEVAMEQGFTSPSVEYYKAPELAIRQ